MAKNDAILLDGIIDQRLEEVLPSAERDEVFEYFAIEQLLKDYDLSRDEIETGWIDGRDDGGIDGFYIFVNGRLLEATEDFVWPRSHASIEVWLITCKHHATFVQAALDAILATIQELFDLSLAKEDLNGSYSDDLLEFRALFHLAYRRLSIGRPAILFNVVYASRGDAHNVGESVAARARQIEGVISGLFSSCSVKFHFVGAAELVELHRRSKTFSLTLPFIEHLATGKDSYVLLVRLEEYWRFVSDEDGTLRRYLFDSNVRDFLGTTGVNDDITRSLLDATAPDFWWLNNGVTILATSATVPGKSIQLQDIQIVNGLQTTETIFRHFHGGSMESRDRALLVKIIVSSDSAARDRIIRATNNQNPVEVAALHATDKIQRDIEEILERHDWYYERRRNYYRNIGKARARFVTPIYLASSVLALVFKNPSVATRLKPKFMRNQEAYMRVFSSEFPIEVWPVLVGVFKAVDSALSTIQLSSKPGERFLSNWRPLVSLMAVAARLGTFAYSRKELSLFDTELLDPADIQKAWTTIEGVQGAWNVSVSSRKPARSSFFISCCTEFAVEHNLSGVDQVGRQNLHTGPVERVPTTPLTPEFVNAVDAALPPQPWKIGMRAELSSKLGCSGSQLGYAIKQLIAEGRRNPQRNGVVYDGDGNVIAVDPDRLELDDGSGAVDSPIPQPPIGE